jgi:hypothetical protein
MNLLESTYLFASGHPRSIEFLVKKVFSNDDNSSAHFNRISELFSLKQKSYTEILYYLAQEVSKICEVEGFSEFDFFDELVLNPTYFVVDGSEIFRTALEKGTIFAQRIEKDSNRIYSAVRACNLIVIMFGLGNSKKDWNESFRLKAFKYLFLDIINLKISDVWERCIDMTILSRSSLPNSLNDILGTKNIISKFDTYILNLSRGNISDLEQMVDGQYIRAPISHPGYVSRMTVSILTIYIQVKIDKSSSINKTESSIRANSIFHTISEHIKYHSTVNLENVHIIFYEWGCIDEYGPAKIKNDIISELDKLKMNSPTALSELAAVRTFIEEFGEENIHVVNRLKLENWLLPSFLPIAYMATNSYR